MRKFLGIFLTLALFLNMSLQGHAAVSTPYWKKSGTQYRATQSTVVEVCDSDGTNCLPFTGGAGTGDMTKAVYDPTGVEADAFDLANSTGDYIQLDIAPVAQTGEGKLWWNADEETLNISTGGAGDTVIQTGQETLTRVYNNTASPISNGKILHPNGTFDTGTEKVPTVELADASRWETTQGTLLVATEDIAIGAVGFATRYGKTRDVDTSLFSAGEQVWLADDGSGDFTNTKPEFPSHGISMGGTLDSALSGEIFTSPTTNVYNIFADQNDGSFIETIRFTVSSDGATITGSLEAQDDSTRDLTMYFSDGFSTLDTTPALTVTLTAGTDTTPQTNYVYIPKSTKLLTASTSDWPAPDVEHIRVAQVLLTSASSTELNGALRNQNWNDHVKAEGDNGHLLHITERLRQENSKWDSGAFATATLDTNSVYISNTAGVVYQLHKQNFPVLNTQPYTIDTVSTGSKTFTLSGDGDLTSTFPDGRLIQVNSSTGNDGLYTIASTSWSDPDFVITVLETIPDATADGDIGDDIHVVNDFTSPYDTISSLTEIATDASGNALLNTSYSVVIWGVMNKSGQASHLMANFPTDTYNKNFPDAAVTDANNYSVYSIPKQFQGVGFLIARVTLINDGGTYTIHDTEDLRGFIPNTTAGGGAGGAGVTEFTALTDTPSSYTGQGGKIAAVNVGETALEFIDASGGLTWGDSITDTTGTGVTTTIGASSAAGTIGQQITFDNTQSNASMDGLNIALGTSDSVNKRGLEIWGGGASGTGYAIGLYVATSPVTSGAFRNNNIVVLNNNTNSTNIGVSGNHATGTGLSIVQGGTNGTAIAITGNDNVNSTTNGLVNYTLSATQSGPTIVTKTDTGSSAQGHTAHLIDLPNASTLARGVDVDQATTGTGTSFSSSVFANGAASFRATNNAGSAYGELSLFEINQGLLKYSHTSTNQDQFYNDPLIDIEQNSINGYDNTYRFKLFGGTDLSSGSPDRAQDADWLTVKRESITNPGYANTFTTTGSVAKFENDVTNGGGTSADSVAVLEIAQDAVSTGPHMNLNVASAGTATNEGDLVYNGTNLYFKPSGTQVDLLAGGGGGLAWGDSITDTTGTGVSINDYGLATQMTATTTGMIISNENYTNTNSSFDHIAMEIGLADNAGSGTNSGINITNNSGEKLLQAANPIEGFALGINHATVVGGGGGGSIGILVNNNSSTTDGVISQLMTNTQSAASVMHKMDLGTSAQAHKGLEIEALNASSTLRAIDIGFGTTGDGYALYIDSSTGSQSKAMYVRGGYVADHQITVENFGGSANFGGGIDITMTTANGGFGSSSVGLANFELDTTKTSAQGGLSDGRVLRAINSFEYSGTSTANEDRDDVYFKRENIVSNAAGTHNASGSVLKLENIATQTTGVLADTVDVLEIAQDADSTGSAIDITLPDNRVVSTDPVINVSLTDTQTEASTLLNLNLGDAAEAHTGLKITGTGNSTTLKGVHVDTDDGFGQAMVLESHRSVNLGKAILSFDIGNASETNGHGDQIVNIDPSNKEIRYDNGAILVNWDAAQRGSTSFSSRTNPVFNHTFEQQMEGTMTVTSNYDMARFKRVNRSTNSGGNMTASGSVVYIQNEHSVSSGTVNDSVRLLEMVQDTGSTGDVFNATAQSNTVRIDDYAGLIAAKVTSDPCGNMEEGSMFYNDTSNYYCYCNGTDDVKMSDDTTACF